MTTNFLIGIFHWRDHAGPLDASSSHPPASLGTLLWGCNRWLETNPGAANTADGRRVVEIKREIEDWLESQDAIELHGVTRKENPHHQLGAEVVRV